MENVKRNVLVIDDDTETRALFVEILRQEGFDVIEAVDGLDGLEKVSQVTPDVILTGIIMPRMDGFGLVESLKRNVMTANIPVIFLSHMGREEDRARAQVLGVNDFFVTTMSPPRDILGRLNALFSHSQYLVVPNPYELDAQRLAQDLGLNRDFLCSEGGEKLAFRLTLKDANSRRFEAELVCI
ncbi:MAG: response regulator [Candidatus Moranbacteria bacterium]|nr:response regulator [Candidatus Moranbacteria bacterium]NTW45779.1 response regulator [Candidatus Moranbacteria bacterium]